MHEVEAAVQKDPNLKEIAVRRDCMNCIVCVWVRCCFWVCTLLFHSCPRWPMPEKLQPQGAEPRSGKQTLPPPCSVGNSSLTCGRNERRWCFSLTPD